jgi:hypothetical protein
MAQCKRTLALQDIVANDMPIEQQREILTTDTVVEIVAMRATR